MSDKVCKSCGRKLPEGYRKSKCKNCQRKRTDRIKSTLKPIIGVIVLVGTAFGRIGSRNS